MINDQLSDAFVACQRLKAYAESFRQGTWATLARLHIEVALNQINIALIVNADVFPPPLPERTPVDISGEQMTEKLMPFAIDTALRNIHRIEKGFCIRFQLEGAIAALSSAKYYYESM